MKGHDMEPYKCHILKTCRKIKRNPISSRIKFLKCKPILLLTVPADVLALNSYPLVQNGRPFEDDIFSYIFVKEKFCILIKISPKFVAKGTIDNNPALV